MKSKPNVRPKPKNKPAPEENPERDLREVLEEAADKLFEEREGNELLRMRELMKRTLQIYEQDLDRAGQNENPEKFRWRVKPTEMLRLRKEIKGINQEIEELREECWQIARKLISGMMQEQAEQQQHPEGPPPTGKPQPVPGLENPEIFKLPDDLTNSRPPGSS